MPVAPVVAVRCDEADDRSLPAVGHHRLRVRQADRVASDLGEHDGAGGHGVGQSDILSYCLRAHAEITAELVRNDAWSCAMHGADHAEDADDRFTRASLLPHGGGGGAL